MTISIKKTGHRSFNPVLKIWLKNGGHTGQSSLHTGSLQTPAVGRDQSADVWSLQVVLLRSWGRRRF